MKNGQTRADAIRAEKRSEIIESLKNRQLVRYVADTADKLADLSNELDSNAVSRLRAANEARLKLIAKYLPDVKSIELTGEEGASIKQDINIAISFCDD